MKSGNRKKPVEGKTRPLSGRKIIVTRPRARAAGLTGLLEAQGALVVQVPVMKIRKLPCPGLDDAIARLETYDIIAFTSANAVEVFWDRLEASHLPADSIRSIPVAAVGKATAATARQRGLRVVFEAGKNGSAELARMIGDSLDAAETSKVLWPRAFRARKNFASELRMMGCDIDDFAIYDVVPEEIPKGLIEKAADADAVAFASPSAVEFFTRALGPALREVVSRPMPAVCIGRTTAAAAAALGYDAVAAAEENSMESLVEAVKKALVRRDEETG